MHLNLYFLIFIDFKIIKININSSLRETGFEPVSPETVVLKTTGITELTDSRNRCFVILFLVFTVCFRALYGTRILVIYF